MVQAAGKALSFEEFLEQHPDNGGRYELIEGEVVEVGPTGTHEDIGGFIALKLGVIIFGADGVASFPLWDVVANAKRSHPLFEIQHISLEHVMQCAV
ncbi:MAG: hypothetical protein AAFN08_18760 [Cyanobacteria bacterium J06559_3]